MGGWKIFKYSVNGLNRVLAYPAREDVWTKGLKRAGATRNDYEKVQTKSSIISSLIMDR